MLPPNLAFLSERKDILGKKEKKRKETSAALEAWKFNFQLRNREEIRKGSYKLLLFK